MNAWKMGLVGLAFVAAMTACGGRSNNASNAAATFPIKAGERWSATFTNSGGTVTVGFALDGAPEYDDDGDIYADFVTTNNAQGGFGYVITKDNTFIATFIVDRSKRQAFACAASSADAPTRGNSGIIIDNNKSVGTVNCVIRKQ
jgi:hypothetical protein